ncbi:hypothetical protein QJS66_07170 [Kocuria rhizophila]|nr:hypothetical protein QJS66_07170 [Kocuria rhizophila]
MASVRHCSARAWASSGSRRPPSRLHHGRRGGRRLSPRCSGCGTSPAADARDPLASPRDGDRHHGGPPRPGPRGRGGGAVRFRGPGGA